MHFKEGSRCSFCHERLRSATGARKGSGSRFGLAVCTRFLRCVDRSKTLQLGTTPQPEPTATVLQATVPVPIQAAATGYQGRDMSWTKVRCASSQLPSTQSQSSGPKRSSCVPALRPPTAPRRPAVPLAPRGVGPGPPGCRFRRLLAYYAPARTRELR